jgi:hypothetical protein
LQRRQQQGGPINSVGRPHPEEYQSRYHEKSWQVIKARPYLAGSDNFFTGGPGRTLTPFMIVGRGGSRKVVSGTGTPELYDACREGSFRYELPLPDGKWQVTLHLFEPDEAKAASRSSMCSPTTRWCCATSARPRRRVAH